MTTVEAEPLKVKQLRLLTVLSSRLSASNIANEENDKSPRGSLYQRTLKSDMMDESFLEKAPRIRRSLYKHLPFYVAEAIESFIVRKDYDVIVSWSDMHALVFAAILKLTRRKCPHVALMFWISKPKKAFLLKHVYSGISTLVLWTSAHMEFAINKLGIPPEKIKFIPYYVDQTFFRPIPSETDMICSVGIEMRDYPTFIRAMRGVDIRCHIAAGAARGILTETVKAIYREPSLPPNITVGRLSTTELRALYSRSRFVVIPLLPTDSDNGLTSILEAMAMGKAVICSRTSGQRDVIVEGKTGLFVPQGDPSALREAITYLWDRPALADQMGQEGRKLVEEKYTLEQFIRNIKEAAEEAYQKSEPRISWDLLDPERVSG